MDTKSLSCFIACYEMRSINQAAQALYISPQGLGKTISKLESELGVQLFRRTPQGLIPTDSGRYFYEHSSGLMMQIQNLQMEMSRLSRAENKIRIGYSSGVLNIFAIDKMEQFREKHLLDYTEWIEDFNDEIKQKILSNELDTAFVIGRLDDDNIRHEKIFSRKLSAIVYPEHPLYDRVELTMRDFQGESIITLNERYRIYHNILQRCSESGFIPDIHLKTMESELIYKFTNERRGIGIDVDMHASAAHYPGLRCIEISDSIPWSVYAVYSKTKESDTRITDLIRYYRDCLI